MTGRNRRILHFFHKHVLDEVFADLEMRAVAGDIGEPAREIRGEDAMLQGIDPRAFARQVVFVVKLMNRRRTPTVLLQLIQDSVLKLLWCACHGDFPLSKPCLLYTSPSP